MRHLFIILLVFTSLVSAAQLRVTVTPTGSQIVCYKDSVGYRANISGTDTAGVIYRWQKDGIDMPGADSSVIAFPKAKPADTGQYRCIATKAAMTDTSNIVVLHMRPAMKFDTLYRYNPLACARQCKGQFKALVSGGTPYRIYPPYIYDWHNQGHSQDTLCFGLCPGKKWLTVVDSLGCKLDTTFLVDVLKSPKVRYKILPGDTIYLTNPVATLEFNDTARPYLTSWKWYMYYNIDSTVTTSNSNPVQYIYDRSGAMVTMMRFRDTNGCDTTLQDTLIVQIIDLFIPNAMTSNSPNNVLTFQEKTSSETNKTIVLSDVYLSNELWIYDRWGRRVYHTTDYVNSTWDGGKLPDGTYFYTFKGHGPYGDDWHHGCIQIFR